MLTVQSVNLVDDELVAAGSNVGGVNEAVTLDDVVWGEVDGRWVCSQEEVVSQVEQMVWC